MLVGRLSKEMLGTQSFLLRYWREIQFSMGAERVGLASPFAKASDFAKASSDKSEDKSEAALHWRWTSINVTLEKTVDWVELKPSHLRSLTQRLAREPVSKK